MRVMVLVKATAESEAGIMPSSELLEAMGKYNAELVNAGILLAGEGLHPSARGKRVAFDGDECVVLECRGALSQSEEGALWQQVFMVQPARRREFEPSSKRRKRRPASSPPATG